MKIYLQNNSYGKIETICKTCRKKFKFNRSELNKTKGAGSFCSKECQASGHVFIPCKKCGKKFKAYKSDLKRSNKRFCSISCFNSRKNPIEIFFKNISKDNHPDGCWIWEGRKDKDGYGILWNKKAIKAHRYSMELHGNKVPHDMLACHHCDNPPCVNPEHLFIGTNLDNVQDSIKKGRRSKNKSVQN